MLRFNLREMSMQPIVKSREKISVQEEYHPLTMQIDISTAVAKMTSTDGGNEGWQE